MAASGKAGRDALFPPYMPGFVKAQFNNISSVQSALSERTVAIMLEPVQGEAGVYPATVEFINALRQLCDSHGLLLIFDEVQTSCARLGQLFAFQHYGVRPDIMTLGKGLGAGVPISALLAKQHCSMFEHGDQGGTHAGNPLMSAVGLAVLSVLSQPAFLQHVRDIGAYLRKGLEKISQDHHLVEVRGDGLLLALELGHNNAADVVHACRKNGLLVNAPRPHCLRLMPRLNSTEGEIEEGLLRLKKTLSTTAINGMHP